MPNCALLFLLHFPVSCRSITSKPRIRNCRNLFPKLSSISIGTLRYLNDMFEEAREAMYRVEQGLLSIVGRLINEDAQEAAQDDLEFN